MNIEGIAFLLIGIGIILLAVSYMNIYVLDMLTHGLVILAIICGLVVVVSGIILIRKHS